FLLEQFETAKCTYINDPFMSPCCNSGWAKLDNPDILAYGVRVIMYLGLANLMGTVWLRLKPNENTIQSFFNAIFFGSAFVSFMTVAYIPAFLEDLSTYKKESLENMYGPAAFLLANVIVGLPFLFLITILFAVVECWMTDFRSGGTVFFRFVMWLFLSQPNLSSC
ncbi:hypothetical protein V1520DRAFT_284992, partial [Lipomyces starkeyi]